MESEPDVVPSPVDADYECVRVTGPVASPPGPSPDDGHTPLCPEGYVPRLRRKSYELDGKSVLTDEPPERNPDDPP